LNIGALFDGGQKTAIGSNIGTQSYMFNTLWEYENQTKFTPYIGRGLGWAEHEADTTRANRATGVTVFLDTTTDNFIWAFMLGATYSFTENWNVDLGYRYTDLGDVEIGPFADGGKIDSEYTSHDITIGLGYNFQ